jgi:hypothetical protein
MRPDKSAARSKACRAEPTADWNRDQNAILRSEPLKAAGLKLERLAARRLVSVDRPPTIICKLTTEAPNDRMIQTFEHAFPP